MYWSLCCILDDQFLNQIMLLYYSQITHLTLTECKVGESKFYCVLQVCHSCVETKENIQNPSKLWIFTSNSVKWTDLKISLKTIKYMLMWCQQWSDWLHEAGNGGWRKWQVTLWLLDQPAMTVYTWACRVGRSTETTEGQKGQNTQKLAEGSHKPKVK